MLLHLATIADSIFNPTDAHLEDLVLHIGQCINWVVGFGWEFRFLLDPGIPGLGVPAAMWLNLLLIEVAQVYGLDTFCVWQYFKKY